LKVCKQTSVTALFGMIDFYRNRFKSKKIDLNRFLIDLNRFYYRSGLLKIDPDRIIDLNRFFNEQRI